MKSFCSIAVGPAGGWLNFRTALLALAVLVLPSLAGAEDVMPQPKVDPNLVGDHKREVLLEIKFAGSGKVSSCSVIKGSGAPKLDKATVAFVRENWKLTSEAGHTARVPIDFDAVPKVASQPKQPAKTRTNDDGTQTVPASGVTGYGGAGGGGGYTGTPGGVRH